MTIASGGERRSSASDGVAAELLRLLHSRMVEEEERGAGETEWCLWARDVVSTGISRSAAARQRRRRTAATWPTSGGRRRASARGREREGKPGRAVWLGRKGGGSALQHLPPLLFFLNFFSPKRLNKIFEALKKLFRGWGKKKN